MAGGIQSGAVSSGQTILRIVGPDQLAELDRKAEAERTAQAQPEIDGLARFIQEEYEKNEQARKDSGVEDQMMANLRQRDGKYPPEKLSAIKENGGSDVFVKLTNVKCRAAESWISDVLSNGMEKPWTLAPTPLPDLPVNVEQSIIQLTMQEWLRTIPQNEMSPEETFKFASGLREKVESAIESESKLRAKRMETTIEDQMVEGGWADAFDDFVTDLVTLKVGYIKGPIVRRERKLVWKKGTFGKTVPVITLVNKLCFEHPSAFDCYPSDDAMNPQEGNFIEKVRFQRRSLIDMKGLPGWDEDAIDLILTEYGQGGLREWTTIDQERAELEARSGTVSGDNRNKIAGKEFWGSVQGKELIERGMTRTPDGKPIEPLDEYEVNAIKIGNYIAYCDFNPDPMGERPYNKTGYDKITGSYYYKGVPELMDDLQQICNASVRSMVNNMAVAGGMQEVIEDVNRIPPGENITSAKPFQIRQFINPKNSTLPAVSYFQPESNATEFMGIYEKFAQMSDDYTGIPAYTYGNDKVAGAGRTMGGLTILMNSATRGIKKVIARIDKDVMSPTIKRIYNWNMLYNPDDTIKGDAQILPIGVLGLIVKEQAAGATTEFLATTANPIDQAIMGLAGRAAVLRENAKRLTIPVDDVVPSKEVMKAREDALNSASAGVPPGPQKQVA